MKLDVVALNCEMVARGVRRGYSASRTLSGDIDRWVKRNGGLVSRKFFVADRPRVLDGLIVLREDDPANAAFEKAKACKLTHVELADLLDIPCGAMTGWEGASLCDWFCVDVVPIGTCRPPDEGRLYVTSFWCPGPSAGMRGSKKTVQKECRPL